MSTPLLEVRDYRLAFDTFDGTLHVLDGIDLAVAPGETLTEDEIERTIREIREAISRGGAH